MKNNVLATLAYYDVLDFPLKVEEIWRYLVKIEDGLNPENPDRLKVKKMLDDLILEGIINREGDLYFLSGRDYLVPLRIKREKISRKKMELAQRAIRWLKLVPHVQAVFASGSLALNNCDELSDLDVLIVTKHGRIWLTRLLVTGLMSLLGVRRKAHEKISPNKICLNHYITDQSLTIPFASMYNAQNYINLKPLLIRDKEIVEKFYRQNSWLARYLKRYDIMIYHTIHKRSEIKAGFLARLIIGTSEMVLNTALGNWIERKSKNYQMKRIRTNPMAQSTSGHIISTDDQLAFHPDSPEKSILEKYRELLTTFLL